MCSEKFLFILTTAGKQASLLTGSEMTHRHDLARDLSAQGALSAVVSGGFLTWIALQRPPVRPNVSITFVGYTNNAAGTPLARFAINNLSRSAIRRYVKVKSSAEPPFNPHSPTPKDRLQKLFEILLESFGDESSAADFCHQLGRGLFGSCNQSDSAPPWKASPLFKHGKASVDFCHHRIHVEVCGGIFRNRFDVFFGNWERRS